MKNKLIKKICLMLCVFIGLSISQLSHASWKDVKNKIISSVENEVEELAGVDKLDEVSDTSEGSLLIDNIISAARQLYDMGDDAVEHFINQWLHGHSDADHVSKCKFCYPVAKKVLSTPSLYGSLPPKRYNNRATSAQIPFNNGYPTIQRPMFCCDPRTGQKVCAISNGLINPGSPCLCNGVYGSGLQCY